MRKVCTSCVSSVHAPAQAVHQQGVRELLEWSGSRCAADSLSQSLQCVMLQAQVLR